MSDTRLLTAAEVRDLHDKLLRVNKAIAFEAHASADALRQLYALKAVLVARLTQCGGLS